MDIKLIFDFGGKYNIVKIENERYVLVKQSNDEDMYLTEEYGLTNDIREALKIKHIITAQNIRQDFAMNHNFYLDIVPLTITYAWSKSN